jgi:hypothetical protein
MNLADLRHAFSEPAPDAVRRAFPSIEAVDIDRLQGYHMSPVTSKDGLLTDLEVPVHGAADTLLSSLSPGHIRMFWMKHTWSVIRRLCEALLQESPAEINRKFDEAENV